MAGVGRAVSGDTDMIRLTVAIPVVHAVYRLAVNLKAALRGLEQVVERPVPILVKASAAGIAAVFGLASVHDDGLFTAVIITVMKTVCYITIQFCHDGFPPEHEFDLQPYDSPDCLKIFPSENVLFFSVFFLDLRCVDSHHSDGLGHGADDRDHDPRPPFKKQRDSQKN